MLLCYVVTKTSLARVFKLWGLKTSDFNCWNAISSDKELISLYVCAVWEIVQLLYTMYEAFLIAHPTRQYLVLSWMDDSFRIRAITCIYKLDGLLYKKCAERTSPRSVFSNSMTKLNGVGPSCKMSSTHAIHPFLSSPLPDEVLMPYSQEDCAIYTSEVKPREESLVHYVCTETKLDQRLNHHLWLPLSALHNYDLRNTRYSCQSLWPAK